MEEPDDAVFRIEFTSCVDLSDDAENYLTLIKGEIIHLSDDGQEMIAGKLLAFYADIDGASNAGYEPFYILDMHGSTAPYYSALFDPKTDEFKSGVNKTVNDSIFSTNLLILDRLEILPKYRKRKLGLACLYRCIQQYSHGCGLVALKPFPLQFQASHKEEQIDEWNQQLELGKFNDGSLDIGRAKLANYYSRLGFKKVRGTDIMILSPAQHQPGLEDIGYY